MDLILVIFYFTMFFYLLVQFSRQEYMQDEYEDTIYDVEGRLEWARTRTLFPFGMKAQLTRAGKLLERAKNLWQRNKWQQAYQVALESQEAMNRAQSIYCSVINRDQKKGISLL